MTSNVWFEEVNIGLINEIKKTVRIKDQDGYLMELNEKSVMVRKPEDEFKFEMFPCVSIYNKGYEFDSQRYSPAPVVVSRDIDSKTAVVEQSAIPYNLNYQIDFWSQYQEDMDTMTRTWLSSHFKNFNLSVIDDGGTPRSCNCIPNGSVKNQTLYQVVREFFTPL